MNRLQELSDSIKYERHDRNWSIGLGIGLLALYATGVWVIATKNIVGIIPAVGGAFLAKEEFSEAIEANHRLTQYQAELDLSSTVKA